MKKFLTTAGAAALVAAVFAATSAGAVVTKFADYQSTGGANVRWVLNTTAPQAGTGGSLISIATPSSTATTAAPVAVVFTFDNLPYLSALGPLQASVTFTATAAKGTPTIGAGGFLIQDNTNGNFSITYTGAADLHVGVTTYHTGANLLTASFTDGAFFGPQGGTSASFNASTQSTTNPATITYTSDLLSFIATNDQDITIGLSAVTNNVTKLVCTGSGIHKVCKNVTTNAGLQAAAGKALTNFYATSQGAFSTDPQPVVLGVPEPASWALMMIGVGSIGAIARRRKLASVSA